MTEGKLKHRLRSEKLWQFDFRTGVRLPSGPPKIFRFHQFYRRKMPRKAYNITFFVAFLGFFKKVQFLAFFLHPLLHPFWMQYFAYENNRLSGLRLVHSLISAVQIVSFLLPPCGTKSTSINWKPRFFPTPLLFHPKQRHSPLGFSIRAISLSRNNYLIYSLRKTLSARLSMKRVSATLLRRWECRIL